jgi:hypothetical protein
MMSLTRNQEFTSANRMFGSRGLGFVSSFGFRHSDFIFACLLALALWGMAATASAQTRTLRIVTYNLGSDINGITGPQPGLIAPPGDTNNFAAGGVLEGIGEELLNGNAQPLDILALQETTSNPLTVAPIVSALNTFYGVPGMYSNSSYQATESGGFTGSGNGPNAVIFNTRMVRLLASVPVDPPGGPSALGATSGEYREVMRYQFTPAGVTTNAANLFYVYVSHYKSGTGTQNEADRQGEAQIIRSNSASLPPTARVLYVGDFNTGIAAEGMYVTLIESGPNQAIDPVNPAGNTNLTWDSNSALGVKTFSPTAIHYRDDYQMMTTNVYYGNSGGLALVSDTYHVFGNNGTTPYTNSVNSPANTALNKLCPGSTINAPQLFLDLANASDHLPVVADYTIPVPAPRIADVTVSGTNLIFDVTNGITNATYIVLTSTSLVPALTNWTAVASNTAMAGNFTFIATNVVNASAPGKFFILRGR